PPRTRTSRSTAGTWATAWSCSSTRRCGPAASSSRTAAAAARSRSRGRTFPPPASRSSATARGDLRGLQRPEGLRVMLAMLLAATLPTVAVLELSNEIRGPERDQVDRKYFTDLVRGSFSDKGYPVTTRENEGQILRKL